MGQILNFPTQAARGDSFSGLLASLIEAEKAGEMKGLMYFWEGSDGKTNYGIHGGYADRMQFAAYTLLKGLNAVTEKIVESGSAGHTFSATVKNRIPRRPAPRYLRGSP